MRPRIYGIVAAICGLWWPRCLNATMVMYYNVTAMQWPRCNQDVGRRYAANVIWPQRNHYAANMIHATIMQICYGFGLDATLMMA